MKRAKIVSLFVVAGAVLLLTGWRATILWAQAQASTDSLTAEQQKQLEQLKQLDTQLQKDRAAVHDAISKYGWDSDQTDAAQEQLFRDRSEYRQLRRTLRQAGVPVTAPQGVGPGSGFGPGSGRRGMRGGRGMCPCPCGGM